jgi:hypothetical protein
MHLEIDFTEEGSSRIVEGQNFPLAADAGISLNDLANTVRWASSLPIQRRNDVKYAQLVSYRESGVGAVGLPSTYSGQGLWKRNKWWCESVRTVDVKGWGELQILSSMVLSRLCRTLFSDDWRE